MSPAAVALAVLLHAMVALGLWWLAQEPKAPAEPALEVYFEPAPKPEEKPPEPEQKPEPPKPEPQPQPQPQPPPPQVIPPIEALAPPAEIVADKPTQAPPKGDKPKDAELAPPPPPLQDVLPSPDQDLVEPPTAAEFKEFAKVEPTPAPPPPTPPAPMPIPPAPTPPAAPPQPQLQSILPSPGEDLPAPTAADFAKVEPKPPTPAPQEKKPPEPPKPQQQALAKPPEKPVEKPQPPQAQPQHQPQQQQQAKPPMPQLQKPEYKPSPLSTAPSHRPPAGTQSENPSPSPFVNPADTYNKARAADNYLWQVVRRLQGYRYTANVSATQGITVVRVVIARDGRLLNVTVSRSSGVPEFDQGVLAGVRSGSPYAPLPPDIKGDSATFDLPLVSSRRM
ncbi:MAG: TonB family protein [Reyranella sp.]|nr:TonB family protein [Reyranella sp.]